MPPLPIVLVGPPASGKGTQAARLSSDLNIPAISTGEILRREEASGSETGRLLQNLLASGRLVSDEVVMQVVQHRLAASDCGGDSFWTDICALSCRLANWTGCLKI